MNDLTIFYLKECPFCNKAFIFIDELIKENPIYSNIKIHKIEETQEKAVADSYDYYYVPCFYHKSKKLHEGAINKQEIKKIFDEVVKNYL